MARVARQRIDRSWFSSAVPGPECPRACTERSRKVPRVRDLGRETGQNFTAANRPTTAVNHNANPARFSPIRHATLSMMKLYLASIKHFPHLVYAQASVSPWRRRFGARWKIRSRRVRSSRPAAKPQRLKPLVFPDVAASLKRCPDTNLFFLNSAAALRLRHRYCFDFFRLVSKCSILPVELP